MESLSLVKTEENEVDRLLARIAEIQENCDHEFSLSEELELKESLIKGVYFQQGFTYTCSKCSLEEKTNSSHTCPRCFTRMPNFTWARKFQSWGDEMTSYFGGTERSHGYYSPVLSACKNCGFEVVGQEWDQ